MAGKGAPPPYSQGGYPPAQGGVNVVYVQQPPPKVVAAPQPRTTHGLFGFVEKELNAAGKMIDRELGISDTVANQQAILRNFNTNNTIQLISRSSGGTLQVVQAATGQLVIDGSGPDAQMFNNVWSVINEGKNQVRLHNNNNFLAIVNGVTTVIHMPPGSHHGVETKFQIAIRGNFVCLESCKESGRHIGILNNGSLKSALATGKEEHAHFAVRLVSTPYH